MGIEVIYRQAPQPPKGAILDPEYVGMSLWELNQKRVSPNEFTGETQHARVTAAVQFIKKRGFGILELGTDTVSVPNTNTWIMESALLLPSNCWLMLKDSTLKLADGVFDNIIRNEGIQVDPANPYGYALELQENKNIRIIGSGVGSAFIEGPNVPYTAPHPYDGGDAIPWVGDGYGWRTLGILLANVKDYKVHGFTMRNTTCWAISQEHGCDGMEIHDIKFQTTVQNGDGIDFRKGCSNGKVWNITGNTSDDTIAMTAAISALADNVYPNGAGNRYLFPLQVGGKLSSELGDKISNITIDGVTSQSLHHQVRILASGGATVENINISGVRDTGAVIGGQVTIRSQSGGEVSNVFVNGIRSDFTYTPLKLEGVIKDSQINFIRQGRGSGILFNDSSATLVNTEITNAEFIG